MAQAKSVPVSFVSDPIVLRAMVVPIAVHMDGGSGRYRHVIDL
jgi:hypothetical protein